jgi:hypothetical protein
MENLENEKIKLKCKSQLFELILSYFYIASWLFIIIISCIYF